jgi:hypothetical protein
VFPRDYQRALKEAAAAAKETSLPVDEIELKSVDGMAALKLLASAGKFPTPPEPISAEVRVF